MSGIEVSGLCVKASDKEAGPFVTRSVTYDGDAAEDNRLLAYDESGSPHRKQTDPAKVFQLTQ